MLIVAGVVTAVFAASRFRTRDIEAAMIADVEWAQSVPADRIAHVDRALEGSFGDHLEAHIDSLIDARHAIAKLSTADSAAFEALQIGRRSPARMPPAIRKIFDEHHGDVRGALLAAQAQTARPPASMRGISDPNHPHNKDAWSALDTAARIAAIEMFREIEAGRPRDAVATCLDTLALGRDSSWSIGAYGQAVGGTIVLIAQGPCLLALDRADETTAAKAAKALETIRDGFRRIGDSVREDELIREIMDYSLLVPTHRHARLSAEVRDMRDVAWDRVASGTHSEPDPFLSVLEWRQARRLRPQLVAAVELTIEARDLEIDRILSDSVVDVRETVHDPRRADDLRRRANAALSHLAMVAAAIPYSQKHHMWPKDGKALTEDGWLGRLPIDPRSGEPIECMPSPEYFACPAQQQNVATRGDPFRPEPRIRVRAR